MRLLTRWLVLHGLVRFATRRWAAAGDLQAALIADPTVRADPIPAYERIRAQGPLVRTRIGYITADYQVSQAVLRSEDFGVTSIATNVPPWLRPVERATRGIALHPLEEPSLLSIEPPDHPRYRALRVLGLHGPSRGPAERSSGDHRRRPARSDRRPRPR